ncbi:Uncharacterized protein APZ42_029651 [Daphnia magna]|uniref:Uncharacterized protein n=1 Tax=Daphnia magna TaxID=35525 RepID=A0A164PFA1_9CRUS|nr:Uncharacterized protein APZ42_029651 [Daphnia magna]
MPTPTHTCVCNKSNQADDRVAPCVFAVDRWGQ